ncbi:LCP family protein [Corticicoccus populi]|uniref:LCP family protein n=1 Tax=Corticicoccus populi TaxID=1812821 RepID=A0ABW5WUU3_9STAP
MKKIIISIIVILAVVLVGVGIYIFNLFNAFEQGVSDSYQSTDRERSELREDDGDESPDSFTILILGIDESESRSESDKFEENDFRTDTMILATFNKDENEVKLVSIPRDTLSYFPEENYFDKITHAHRINGPDSSISAVESLLNVPVDYYARVNMNALVDVVDTLDGVNFDVPFDMDEPDSTDDGRTVLEAGEQELNGEEALAVVRSRKVDTDLGRGNRQLEMVEAILEKAKSTGALTQIDDLISVVAGNSRHNLESETVRSLATYYAFNTVEFNNVQLRGTDYWNPGNGAYFYMADPEHLYAISQTIRESLGMDAPDPNDLINIRLSDYIVPYEYLDDYMLNEYEPEVTPYFLEDGYENQYGDGFDVPEAQEAEGDPDIEGEDGYIPEEGTEEEGAGDGMDQGYDESYDESYDNGEGTNEDYYNDAGEYYDDGTASDESYY